MIRRIVVLVGIVLLLAVAGVGAWETWSRRSAEPVVVATIGTVSQIVVATGRVAPVTEIIIANKVPGRIKAVLVKEGDVVEMGQPLILFEDDEAQAEVRMAAAKVVAVQADTRRTQKSLEAARARWIDIKSGARPQEIERARADLAQAQQRWDNAELERTRYARLSQAGHVARQHFDAVAMEADLAKSRLRSARETLSLVLAGPKPETVKAAWAQVQEAESAVRHAEAQIPQAVAERDRARATLKTMTVDSTMTGRVTKKIVEPGEAVDIGIPLMILSDVSKSVVRAEIDETDVGKLRLGQTAHVTTDAYPGRTFPGTIYEIGQSVGKRRVRPDDPVKIGDMKVLEAKLEVTEGGEDLKLGMTVDVKVFVTRKERVLVIPRHLVPLGMKDATIAVEGPDGPSDRRITLGVWDDARVEVTGGLTAGDRVIDRRPATP